MKKLIAIAVALTFLGPSTALLGVGVLMNPAATATCVSSSLIVGPVPDSLTATTRAGETVTLNKTQLTHAATIITVGAQTAGVGQPGVVIALMAALTQACDDLKKHTNAGLLDALKEAAECLARTDWHDQPSDDEGEEG